LLIRVKTKLRKILTINKNVTLLKTTIPIRVVLKIGNRR